MACFVIYSIIFKPDFVFDPIKQLLNKPYPSLLEKHSDLKIDLTQMNLGKDSSITLSEDQVFNIINDTLPQAAISRVELEENRIVLFRNIADKGKPLWLIVEFTVEGNEYKLDKVGFGWLKVPDIFKDRVLVWINENFNKFPGFKISDFLGGELGLLLNPEYITIQKDSIDVKLIGIDSSKFKGLVDSVDPHKYNQGIEETIKEISNSIKNLQKTK
ncbi:hypothetical protein KBD45_02080 [Candidatus Dojkabacteria bacterium]|nr:hypothetical protein [Candidatus Dojkabacteria bacterium]